MVEEGLEDLEESLLHDAIGHNRNPEGTKNSSVRRFRDIHPPHGMRLESALNKLASDLAQMGLQIRLETADGDPVETVRPLVGPNLAPGPVEVVRVVDLVDERMVLELAPDMALGEGAARLSLRGIQGTFRGGLRCG
jgi:hypothetical protein